MTEPESLRTAAYEYEQHIAKLERLINDMVPYIREEIGTCEILERVKALGLGKE